MTRPTLEFWFDFASTYSYPASHRVSPLARAAGVDVVFRPFMLGAIFRAQGWDTSPFNIYPAKGRYMWRDLKRICDDLALPLVRPDPFPQNSLLAARVAIAAQGQLWAGDYCVEVFRQQFAEGRAIDDSNVIRSALAPFTAEADRFLEAAQTQPVKDALRHQTEKAAALEIFGAPTFITSDRELFWGNDRLEAALRWSAFKP